MRHPKWPSRGTHTQTRHRHKQRLLLGSCTALRRGQRNCSCCPQMSAGGRPAKRTERCRKRCCPMRTPDPPGPATLSLAAEISPPIRSPTGCLRSTRDRRGRRPRPQMHRRHCGRVDRPAHNTTHKRCRIRRRAQACAGLRAPSRAAPGRAPTTDPRGERWRRRCRARLLLLRRSASLVACRAARAR